MSLFFIILIASVIGGIFSLIGGLLLLFKEAIARKISLYLISFASGSLLAAAFMGLLPEALELFNEKEGIELVLGSAILGILLLFMFERFLKWYHCHDRDHCEVHTWSSSVIFGDAIHNFIDGITIAASFMVSVPVGIATTIAVFFHEIPQEIGDFGVLLHAGYSRLKVIMFNFLGALATPLGAFLSYFFLPYFEGILPYFLALAAGSFIYISVADLLPQIHNRTRGSDFSHLLVIILGIATIFFVGILVPE